MGVGSFGGFNAAGGFMATRSSTASTFSATSKNRLSGSNIPDDEKKPKKRNWFQRLIHIMFRKP